MHEDEPMLKFFSYGHLPPHLQGISAIFCNAAAEVVAAMPRSSERTVALRKLLEAKDAGVRAFIYPEEGSRHRIKP